MMRMNSEIPASKVEGVTYWSYHYEATVHIIDEIIGNYNNLEKFLERG